MPWLKKYWLDRLNAKCYLAENKMSWKVKASTICFRDECWFLFKACSKINCKANVSIDFEYGVLKGLNSASDLEASCIYNILFISWHKHLCSYYMIPNLNSSYGAYVLFFLENYSQLVRFTGRRPNNEPNLAKTDSNPIHTVPLTDRFCTD